MLAGPNFNFVLNSRVFGYNNMHKVFKYVSSGRVCISRDITFDESIFPFSTLHSNARARLRSDISLLPPNLLNPVYDQGGEFMGDHMFNYNPSTLFLLKKIEQMIQE